MVEKLSKNIFGKLFGDKGYISLDLVKSLLKNGLEFFTNIRSDMKQKMISLTDKILLRKRSLIETVNDQLKDISQIEHTRHRSASKFFGEYAWRYCCILSSTKKTFFEVPSTRD